MIKGSIPSGVEKKIKGNVLSENCVAFVGAGLSIPPGRDWDLTVQEIAKHCRVSTDEGKEHPTIIDECLKKDENACNEKLREIFPKHVATSRKATDYLLRLPFKAILTTNFDPWLHQQSRQERYKRLHVYPDLPLKDGLQGGLYYLHGYFDSERKEASIRSLVFGEKSFHEAYNRSLLPGFLLNTFTYENILFLGIDPTEKNISDLLRKSIRIRKDVQMSSESRSDEPGRFILWPSPKGPSGNERKLEENKLSLIQSLDIEPLVYQKKADDYRGLEEILFGWVQEGDIRNRPPPFKSGFD